MGDKLDEGIKNNKNIGGLKMSSHTFNLNLKNKSSESTLHITPWDVPHEPIILAPGGHVSVKIEREIPNLKMELLIDFEHSVGPETTTNVEVGVEEPTLPPTQKQKPKDK